MKPHTENFLETLLWVQESEGNDNVIKGKTVHDFHPEFVRLTEQFIDGFLSFLDSQGFDLDRLETLHRTFGGNVYFSLSGHGCGFFDEYPPGDSGIGDELQALLELYSGNKYRFEQLDYNIHVYEGKIDLAFLPKFVQEYRAKLFTVEPQPTPKA